MDVEKIAWAYASFRENQGNIGRGTRVSVLGVNTDRAKLEVMNITWTPSQMSAFTTPTELEGTASGSSQATLTTTDSLDKAGTLSITSGTCIGINKEMRLPLPGDNNGQVKVKPYLEEQVLDAKVKVSLRTSTESGRSVQVSTQKLVYSGNFTAQVKLVGDLSYTAQKPGEPNRSGGSMSYQAIIEQLMGQNDPSVGGFKKTTSNEYYIQMTGHLDYEVERGQNHTWAS